MVGPPNVRFGSLADIQRDLSNVCFTPKSRHYRYGDWHVRFVPRLNHWTI